MSFLLFLGKFYIFCTSQLFEKDILMEHQIEIRLDEKDIFKKQVYSKRFSVEMKQIDLNL